MENNTTNADYTSMYQNALFQCAEPTTSSDVQRKCFVIKYNEMLKQSENGDMIGYDFLKDHINNYAKLMMEKYNKRCKSIYTNNLEAVLSHVRTNNSNSNWHSGLNKVDLNSFVKPLPCSQTTVCHKSENVDQKHVDEFMKHYCQKNTSDDQEKEPKLRKIAKSFAPQSCNKDKRIIKNTSYKCFEQKPTTSKENDFTINDSKKEVDKSINAFKTARDELNFQNSKKFGSSSTQYSNQSYQQTNAATKRKLGTRRGVQNKFISPMLSNNDSSEETLPRSEEWSGDEVIDERLKNIEPRMVELIRAEIMDNGPAVDWNDIAGLDFAKTAIQEAVVWPLLRPDIFTGLRRPPKGILLFGPPGTGKTLIGKCVASQSKSTFFSISASSLTSKWVGEGEKMVRALFSVARCHQPAVIFIDEIDSLLSQRSETEHESSRRIKTEFLIQLDGATTDSEERLLVIGATNRPQELDEAARRRFVKRLYIPLPEFEARFQLVQKLMSQEKHSLSNNNIIDVAKLSDGYSGADMRNLCSEACLGPIRCIDIHTMQSIQAAEVRPVSMDDFSKALSRVRSSVSSTDLDQYIKWNKTYGSDNSI